MTYENLLQRLFDASSDAFEGEGIGAAVDHLEARRREAADELEAALMTSAASTRPWLVHAVALQSSLRRLLEDRRVPLRGLESSVVCFCASEAGGNHPRAIETTLRTADDGGFTMAGVKRWATLAPIADHLLVIASAGREGDRNELRAVLVPATASGLYVEDMTIPGAKGAALHLPNGLVQIEDVHVKGDMILAGDGYTDYLKPFRTIEDLYVSACRAAAMLGLALRHEAPESVVERLAGVLASLHAVANVPHLPSSHLVIGAAESALGEQLAVLVESLPEAEASWWRGTMDLEVAATAKARRRTTALGRLGSG